MLVNITFTPTPGSYGTQVEYRLASSTTWITPTSPANPTMLSTYPLDLAPNAHYYVRVSSVGLVCTPKPVIISVVTPSAGNCCPDGYTLSADGTYCSKTEVTLATAPTNPQTLQYVPNVDYGVCGTYIYAAGYSTSGTGSSAKIPTNSYWGNGPSDCTAPQTITDGPLNRTAVWSTLNLGILQTIGFSVCIDVPVTKTYYIGMGVDNYGSIKVDGKPILIQDYAAINAQYGATNGATFKIWHIYPVELRSGKRIVELIGTSYSGPAAFGAQIYDNTIPELVAAGNDGELNIIFDTKDYVGTTVTMGSDGQGYSCPTGYSLNVCESPYVCMKTTFADAYECGGIPSIPFPDEPPMEEPAACPAITIIQGEGGLA